MNKNFKKTEDDVKAKLLRSIKGTNEKCNAGIYEDADQMTRFEDATSVSKQDEEVIITQKRKLLNCCLNKVVF